MFGEFVRLETVEDQKRSLDFLGYLVVYPPSISKEFRLWEGSGPVKLGRGLLLTLL